jgi:hypothetical protein
MAAFRVYLPEAARPHSTLSGHQARLSDSPEADKFQAGICPCDLDLRDVARSGFRTAALPSANS